MNPQQQGSIRLNKFIANSGVCSRREADRLIAEGKISVNGKAVKEMGLKVTSQDIVTYKGKQLSGEKYVYILLNKPKDCITTASDPQNRRTVYDHIKGACKERVHPVGRLDRNTTGVLLFTNNGELTMRLTHPSSNIAKRYQVTLDKNLAGDDLQAVIKGVTLKDGIGKFDYADYTGGVNDAKEITIELHSGKNRIVRRMFEMLGYRVVKLDRIMFAGLTKKNVPRGKWRLLSEQEIGFLHKN